MRIQLIDDAGSAWRMLSVQAQAIGAALVTTWMLMPEEWKATISPKMMAGVALTFFVAGVVGRLVKQPKLHPEPGEPESTRPQEDLQ